MGYKVREMELFEKKNVETIKGHLKSYEKETEIV